MIGARLAHYEIIAHLGTGGMGEVYQATDSKLGRSVAIKLLPDAFTHDAERAERFQREARVLASLNHPNIAAIHGIEQSDNRKFIVMEFVPGETLAERIQRGSMPLDEVVTVASQLLDGLEAAHEKGVIHRDLKPANIKLTPQGQLKVLDFGLAKANERDPAQPGLSNSPTMMNLSATNGGMILGTAAYMSPEQARGRPVDRRTDIFAFGCVLYEMLTGKAAFDGEDVAEILSRVLQREPDWTQLPPAVPPGIRQVLRLCLDKNAQKRRNSAADVRLDIEQAMAAPAESPVLQSATPAAQMKSRIPWLAAAGFAIAAAVLAWTHFREITPTAPLVRFELLARVGGRQYPLSVSPNGRWLAYYDLAADGRRFLFLRDLTSKESHTVPGTEVANVGRPIWSPDSRYVAFASVNGFMRIAPEGGTPQPIFPSLTNVTGAWNREGVFIRSSRNGIDRSSGTDRQFSPLVSANTAEADSGFSVPQFLPDGRHYVFSRTSRNPNREGVFAASLDSAEEPKRLTGGANPAPARDPITGRWYLFVTHDGQVTAQLFDPERLNLTGDALTLGSGLYASVSENGVLAINHGDSTSSILTWYDRKGNAVRSLPPEPALNSLDISPDGSRVVVSDLGDLWLRDLARGTTARFTTDRAGNSAAVWSPLGDRIAFSSRRSAQANIHIRPSNAATADEQLLTTGKSIWVNDWSRDGKSLLYSEDGFPEPKMDLFTLPMDQPKETRKPVPYLTGPFNKKQGQFSPDGRFVAYASDESGRFEIYVQPFPDPAGGKWPISTRGGLEPRWHPNGKELLYLWGKKLMAVEVKTTPGFSVGVPRELFEAPIQTGWTNDGHRWHVAPDGTFLFLTFPPELTSYPITVIVNWPELLRDPKGR